MKFSKNEKIYSIHQAAGIQLAQYLAQCKIKGHLRVVHVATEMHGEN